MVNISGLDVPTAHKPETLHQPDEKWNMIKNQEKHSSCLLFIFWYKGYTEDDGLIRWNMQLETTPTTIDDYFYSGVKEIKKKKCH